MTRPRRFTRRRILLAFCTTFFLMYWLPSFPFALSSNHLILNQPDEGMFYEIARQVALGESPGRNESLTSISQSQVHPRSATVVGGRIVPIAFPGAMILLGLLTRLDVMIVGDWIINISLSAITPLLAALTPLLLYYLVRRISGQSRLAFHSAMLLFIVPPFWYYASRPFQPHMLLVFLLLAGGALFVSALHKHDARRRWFLLAAFTFVGLAIAIRPSELLWVAGVGLYTLALSRKELHKADWRMLVPATVIVLACFFVVQATVYGHIFGTGYVRPAADGTAGLISSGEQGISFVRAIIAPFGVSFIAIAKTVYHYLLRLFPLWSVVTIVGTVIIVWIKADDRRFMKYIVGYAIAACLLLVYYGSWQFTDNLAGQVSIGSSQVRYLLPIYVAATPILGMCSVWLFKHRRRGQLLAAFFIGALAFSSYSSVFASFEGIHHIRTVKTQYADWQARIYGQTSVESVIITRYADKYLYPGRKVIAGLDDAEMRAGAAALLDAGTELYLYDLAGYAQSEVVQDWLTKNNAILGLMDQFEGLELYRIEKNL